jgi:hypothetical protein
MLYYGKTFNKLSPLEVHLSQIDVSLCEHILNSGQQLNDEMETNVHIRFAICLELLGIDEDFVYEKEGDERDLKYVEKINESKYCFNDFLDEYVKKKVL